jgi:hypothetical protein
LAGSGHRPSTLRLGEHEWDTWILTAGEGRQRGGGVDWAATVSTGGQCSLMRTLNLFKSNFELDLNMMKSNQLFGDFSNLEIPRALNKEISKIV